VHTAAESGGRRTHRAPLFATVLEIVDAAQVDQLLERQLRCITQLTANLQQLRTAGFVRHITGNAWQRQQPLAEAGGDLGCETLTACTHHSP
jgi:hypothetical protein